MGRVLRVRDADTSGLANQWVVVHRIGQQVQGPVDSQRTDAAGRFLFRLPAPDSGDVFVLSSRYMGIGYFSEPVHIVSGRADPVAFAVFDTSVVGPPLRVGIRHVVITRGDAGTRRVLDVFQVENVGQSTRVARDSLAPVWTARLPPDIEQPEPGESDLPSNMIRFEGGSLVVAAPFPPGLKQVVITYRLSPGSHQLAVPIDQPTERLEVLIEDSTATASDDLSPDDPVDIEGRVFRRYTADSIAAGSTPSVSFTGVGSQQHRDYTWIIVTVAGLALAGLAVFGMRKNARARLPVSDSVSFADSVTANGELLATDSDSVSSELSGEPTERLTAMIAALDDIFAGKESETPAENWRTYQDRRAALRAELERRVART